MRLTFEGSPYELGEAVSRAAELLTGSGLKESRTRSKQLWITKNGSTQ